MKNKYSSLIKNIGLFTIGSFGSKIVSFLMVPIYTAVLSSQDVGTVDLILSTISMITPVLLLSIQDATLRFGMDPEYNKGDVLSTTFNIIYKGTVILILGIVFVNFIGLLHLTPMYYFFFVFIFTVGAFNNCTSLYLKAKNKASVIAVSGILCTLFMCASNILFLVVFDLGIYGYMLSNAIGLGVQFLYQFFVGNAFRDLHFIKYRNLSKPMTKYSRPLIANSLAWWINNASDRYILTWICGVATNGIYSISYKVPTIVTTFQSIFYNAWSISAISEFDKDDKDGFLGHNYMLYSCISVIVCSAVLLFNIPIARILYSGEFFIAWRCVPFLLVSTVFNGISQFEGALFAAVKETKKVSVTTLLGAIVNTCLNFMLIQFWGAVGAAFATLFGYLTMWLMRTYFLQSFIKLKVNWLNHFITMFLIIIQSVLSTLNVFLVVQIIIFILIVIIYHEYWRMILAKFSSFVGKR